MFTEIYKLIFEPMSGTDPATAPRADPSNNLLHFLGLGYRVQGLGLGFRVWGLGFGVWGLGFRVSGRLNHQTGKKKQASCWKTWPPTSARRSRPWTVLASLFA